MEIRVERITIEYRPVLRNLMELYEYDFSEYSGNDVNEHGLYGYKYIDHYWTEEGRHPYLVRADDKISGFILVRTVTENAENTYYSIAEFFILKKYRRKGVGRFAAFKIFDIFPGEWHVAQIEENLTAQIFWRNVISEYTNGQYKEITETDWKGPVQVFTSEGILANK